MSLRHGLVAGHQDLERAVCLFVDFKLDVVQSVDFGDLCALVNLGSGQGDLQPLFFDRTDFRDQKAQLQGFALTGIQNRRADLNSQRLGCQSPCQKKQGNAEKLFGRQRHRSRFSCVL